MLIWQYEQDGFHMYLVRHRTELSVKTMLHFWIATLGWILHWNFSVSFLQERLTKPVQNFLPQQTNTNTIESNKKKTLLCLKKSNNFTGDRQRQRCNNRKKKYVYAYMPYSLLQHLGRGDTVLLGLVYSNTPSTFTSCSICHFVCYIYALKLTSAIISMVQIMYFLALMKVAFAVNFTFTCWLE